MGSTPVASIDETGIHTPDFTTIWNYFQDAYRGIYGSDVYLGNDSQDGQLLGIFAAAVNDANAMAVQVYNSFSPATAVGTGLSSVVKINGIARKVPSRSTVDLTVVGQAGTIITNGIARDDAGQTWNLPASVIIPFTGQITVTALASTLGAITGPAETITSIVNTQPGWQSVSNTLDATPGLPVETDAQLRLRQTVSTAIPSLGLLDGLAGALWELPDIRSVTIYENPLNAPDANGIPGHCYAIVIDGGDVDQIAAIIKAKKGGGVGTYGPVVRTIVDEWGVPHQIAFWRPATVKIAWRVVLRGLAGFSTNTQAAIAQALSDWTNALGVGKQVRLGRAYVPANLNGTAASAQYEILEPQGLQVAREGFLLAAADVPIEFNEQPVCDPTYVSFSFPPA